MKRHNFQGVGASHGAHRNHRKPGSIGAGSTPSRVFKGLKMSGRMGGDSVTVQNLTVHAVDTDKGLLLIKGAIPGSVGSLVFVKSAAKGASPVSTVDVMTPDGTKSGTVELPAEIFDVQVNIPLIHQVVVGQLAAARQGTRIDQDARRGRRRWPQAVPPEGHRTRPPGLDPRTAVRRRWRGPRPDAA